MAQYGYKALSKDGRKMEGIVEANSSREAVVAIERLGYTPLTVALKAGKKRKAGDSGSSSFFSLKIGGNADRMKSSEVLLFTSELSDLIEAGMTVGAALNCLANQGESDSAQSRIAGDLRDRIMNGEPLSDAVRAHPKTFPPLYSNMIRAGEASGAMIEVLRRLVEYYERSESMRSKIISAMTYPAVVLVFGVVVVTFCMVKIIPQFRKMFESMGDALPLPTKILMGTSDFIIQYGLFTAIVIGAGVALLVRYLKTPEGKRKLDGLKLKAPLIKGIIACGAYSALAYTMRTLLSNGVNVLQALKISQETCGNVVIGDALGKARERVTDGTSISGPLAQSGVFPKMMTDMLAIGEQSGDMPSALEHIGVRYEKQMDKNIKMLTNALEPLMIVMIGGIVGFVAVGILMAVLQATASMGAGG